MQIEFNFNKAASFIRSAAAQGAELVVLPEYQFVNQKLNVVVSSINLIDLQSDKLGAKDRRLP